MLAYDALLTGMKVRKLGLVTPYLGEIQSLIIANYAERGIEVVSQARLEVKDNHAFGTVPPAQVGAMVREVAEARPDAIAIVCTNFRGAPDAARIEAETGIPVLDSVAVTAAHCLRLAGLDPSRVIGWGSVFDRVARLPSPPS